MNGLFGLPIYVHIQEFDFCAGGHQKQINQ